MQRCKENIFTGSEVLTVMEKNVKVSLLFDFYGELLKPSGRNAVDLYYNEDLSLSEIAAQTGITRQGVRDSIKRCEQQLFELEEKLGLFKRFVQLEGGLDRIASLSEQIYQSSANDATKKLALEIKRTAGALKE